MGEFVVITGLSGAGRSLGRRRPRGPRLVRHRQPAARARSPRWSSWRRRPGRGCSGWRSWSAPGHYQDEIMPTLEWLRCDGRRRPGAVPRGLDRRARPPLREHPPAPPISGTAATERLAPAIEQERRLLEPVRDAADVVIDTSDLNVHQLRRRMRRRCSATTPAGCRCRRPCCRSATSTGCRSTSTSCFDCRFLPNPHWVDELRPLTGLDAPVRDYVLGQPAADGVPRDLLTPARAAPPRVRGRGQGLPDHRPRLHRRAPPIGGDRRGGRRPAARADGHHVGVIHRDVDK